MVAETEKKNNKKKMENGPGGGETGDDDAGAGPVNALGQNLRFQLWQVSLAKDFPLPKRQKTLFFLGQKGNSCNRNYPSSQCAASLS